MSDQIDVFDVLIVYSHEIAVSASSKLPNTNFPFAMGSARSNYNNAYAYFLKTCAKRGLSAAFTTSTDIIGAGLCNTYWIYSQDCWIKKQNVCYSKVIFDKFSPINSHLAKLRQMLFSTDEIDPFNNPYLLNLFFDKLKSHRTFAIESIPTEAITHADRAGISLSVKRLNKTVALHKQKKDFGEEIILKDRYGSGGFNIYKINNKFTSSILQIISKHKGTEFIIQPFALFDKGYRYKNNRFSTDIRIIFMGTDIVQVYIRNAKPDDFRCNEHQGGTLTYVTKKDIPKKVLNFAQDIANKIHQPHALFALDFIISNSGYVYFLEGNCGPGIDWNLSLPKNERMSKKLIRTIINELYNRVNTTKNKLNNKINFSSLLNIRLRYPSFVLK